MSEGIITANLGGAKYSVQLVYDDSGWLARVAITNDAITAALSKKNELTIAVDAARTLAGAAQASLNNIIAGKQFSTKPYVDTVNKTSKAYRLAKLDLNRNRAAIDTGRMQLRWLNSVQPNQGMVVDIYCADFDDTLAVGLHVGLLEINNENPKKQGYLIHPNNTHIATIGRAAYSHARDGSMVTAASIQSSSNWAFNYAMFVGWQRFQPLYRNAIVKAVLPSSNVDVTLDAAISSQHPEGHNIDINRTGVTTADMLVDSNIPVWYMDGLGSLAINDKVIIMYEAQDLTKPKVVGFDGATPPPNWGQTWNNIVVFDEVFSDTNAAGSLKLSAFDDVRGIAYSSTTTGLSVTLFDSLGSTVSAYTYIANIPARTKLEKDSGENRDAIFVTPTGIAFSSGKEIAVSFVGDSSNAVLTFAETESGDVAFNSINNASMQWVRTGTYTYERVVQRLSSIPLISEVIGIAPNFGGTRTYKVFALYAVETISSGVISVIDLTPETLIQWQLFSANTTPAPIASGATIAETLADPNFSIAGAPNLTAAELLTLQTQGEDNAAALAKQGLMLSTLNQTVPLLLTTLPAPDPAVLNVWQDYSTDEDSAGTTGLVWNPNLGVNELRTTAISSSRSEGTSVSSIDRRITNLVTPKALVFLSGGSSISRPAVWVHEANEVGFYSFSKGHTAFNPKSIKYTASGVNQSAIANPYILQSDGRAFKLDSTDMSVAAVTDNDIWRILSRAPLSKPTLANPNP